MFFSPFNGTHLPESQPQVAPSEYIDEVWPVDTVEPLIDSRKELVVALQYLCLYAYELLRGKNYDEMGVPRVSYDPKNRTTTTYTEEQTPNMPGVIDFFVLSRTILGSHEAIPSRATIVTEIELPQDTMQEIERTIGWQAANSGRGYLYPDDIQKLRAKLMSSKQEDYRKKICTNIAVSEKGLLLVTAEHDTDGAVKNVLELKKSFFDANELFAPSKTHDEHQLLYRETFGRCIKQYGLGVPQAPDFRETIFEGSAYDTQGFRVDTNDIKIDARAKALLQKFLGRTVGNTWDLAPWINIGDNHSPLQVPVSSILKPSEYMKY